jgi:hypothetical protein
MKLVAVEDDLSECLSNVRYSDDGRIEIGVYRVAFGWRVRAGFRGSVAFELDWCGGGEWSDVEALYSIAKAILEKRSTDRDCFRGIPGSSTRKPYFNDEKFVTTILRLAGEVEPIKLKIPELHPIIKW